MEKKKRFRPTLGQYRALENENKDLKEQVRLLLRAEDFASKEAEIALVDKKLYDELGEEFKKLENRASVLEHSNNLLEEEIKRQRTIVSAEQNKAKRLDEELSELRSRGFWARLLNL